MRIFLPAIEADGMLMAIILIIIGITLILMDVIESRKQEDG